ncbi:MAG: tyrosine-type recombinase/integrase [Gemmatimonadales bacterium]
MPSRSGRGRGTLELRRVFGGIRIRVASGTTDPRRFRLLDAMLLDLWQSGRHDALEAIRDRRLTPLEVYRFWKAHELHRVPSAEVLRPLEATWVAWCAGIAGESHRRAARRSGALLVEHAPAGAVVHDLPAALQQLKAAYAEHPRSVNLARAHCQAFVRDTFGRSHALYQQVQDVAPIPHRRSERIAAPRFEEVATWAAALPADRAAEVWSMYLTGMGAKEYWEDGFTVHGDRVEVRGAKTAGRHRLVPLIGVVVPPGVSEGRWRKAVRAALDGTPHACTPHNLRRGFAHLLELAGVPPSRIRRYLGHGTRSTTDLYTHHEVAPYLATDRDAVLTWLAAHGGVPTLGGPDGEE